MSCNPKALADGTNNYSSARLNPISRVDRTGSESAEAAPAASSSSSAASTSEVIGSHSAGPGLYYHPECICKHGPDNSNGPSHDGCYLNFPSETGSSTTNLPSAASAGREAVGLMTVPTNTAGEGASGTAQLYSGKAGETVNATIEASPSKNFSIKNINGKPTPAFEEAVALHNKFTAEYGGRYPQYNSVWEDGLRKFVARASLSGHPVNPNKPTPGSIQELYEIPTLRITGTFRGQLTAIMGTLTFYSAWSAHANESSTLQKGLLDTTMGAGVADI